MSEQENFSKHSPVKNVFEEMPEDWAELREKILETIPNRIEGLDTKRIADFMSSQGLASKEYLVIYDEDVAALEALLSGPYAGFLGNELERGLFIPELKLSFIRRQREYEKANGPVFTEGMIMHELAHSSSEYSSYVETEKGVRTPRAGFALRSNEFPWGWFLEEGFADMLRAKYAEKNISDEIKREMFRKLGVREDNSIDIQIQFDQEIDGKISTYWMPAKYLYLTPTGNVSHTASGIAGAGLELICNKNKKLYGTLTEARNGDVEKLREIPKMINEMSPGLYGSLQRLAYTDDDFSKGMKEITDRLYTKYSH